MNRAGSASNAVMAPFVFWIFLAGCALRGSTALAADQAVAPPGYAKQATWQETMLATRSALAGVDARVAPPISGHPDFTAWPSLEQDFPLPCDWFLQDLAACGLRLASQARDLGSYPARWFSTASEDDVEQRLILKVAEELGPAAQPIRAELDRLKRSQTPPHSRAWLDLYVRSCEARRSARLQSLALKCPSLVFTKHANLGGSHYAYTEAQSDAQAERHFNPGGALCLLEMHGDEPRVRTLLEDAQGVIRDPDVSYDGRRVLFAWKKSDRLDDFHLYEMELASGTVRPLTFGLGFADYEGAYLPGGDIIFNSTRCVQTVDCFTTEVSNLYTCDKDGRHLRRLGFDQVHTNFPTVTNDGRVLYTRWEYNDRGQIFPQALFQMNPDGTGQSEFYGNNSWFPTTILHARNIPGTQKVLAIATGHHSRQMGKLIVLDPARGRQENEGAQLVAPLRETPAVHVDAFGQEGDLFQYPYPLSETEYLVTYSPRGWGGLRHPVETGCRGRPPLFGLYYMTIDGRRELLARDSQISCNQPVPFRRPAPRERASLVDYAKSGARTTCRTSTPGRAWPAWHAARSRSCGSSHSISAPHCWEATATAVRPAAPSWPRRSPWAMAAGIPRSCWGRRRSMKTVRPSSRCPRGPRSISRPLTRRGTSCRRCAVG